MFSPADKMADVRAARAARVTPPSSGNRAGTNVKRSPQKRPGDHCTHGTYRNAVARACDRANRWAKGPMIIGNDERAVPRWRPTSPGTRGAPRCGRPTALTARRRRWAKSSRMAERYGKIESGLAERIAAELG